MCLRPLEPLVFSSHLVFPITCALAETCPKQVSVRPKASLMSMFDVPVFGDTSMPPAHSIGKGLHSSACETRNHFSLICVLTSPPSNPFPLTYFISNIPRMAVVLLDLEEAGMAWCAAQKTYKHKEGTPRPQSPTNAVSKEHFRLDRIS